MPSSTNRQGRRDNLATEQADIAVVVVHWNVPGLLRICLDSVREEQRASNLSIQAIVIDNASNAHPMHCVMRDFPGFQTLYLSENLGFAGASNIGIDMTDSTAVFLLNPDTRLLPGALETLWRTMRVSPHVGLVAPLLLNPDGSVQSAGYRFPGIASILFDFLPAHPRLVESRWNGRIPAGDGVSPVAIDYPLGAGMFIRRDALTEVGGMDSRYFMYSEEVDLAQRLAHHGWTRLIAPAARVIHYGGQSTGQQSARMYETLWQSRYRYYEQWLPSRRRWLLTKAVELGTKWDDRSATEERRAANVRIRSLFRNGTSKS